MQTKQQIFEQLQSHKAEIRAFGAARIGLFGSYVRNQQNENSDIDLLVEFEVGKKTFRNYMGLYYYLEELMKQKIELVTWETLAPFIQNHVKTQIEYGTVID